ncbi:MAG: 50S ribosomal protein L10 [Candidatus Omnitrophica bacterium]|nr:50S ribosomal protein L10 [Candidatus Omnitrophota bacterium]
MKKIGDIFKQLTDKQLKDDLEINEGLFLFKYTGVTSADLTQLRRNLKGVNAKMLVTKNSFIGLALKSINKGKDVLDFIDGPTALIFVKDDPLGASKVLTDFVKTHETAVLRGGYLNEKVINPQDFKVLSSITSIQVLYQQIVVAFNAPVSKLAMSLNQVVSKIAYALKAVSEKKEK